MKKALITALALSLATTGCSALNPFNWFGRSQPEQGRTLAPKGGYPVAAGKPWQQPVTRVISLSAHQDHAGEIITAVGLPPTQGYWDASLEALNDGNPDETGTLTYRFMLSAPPGDSADAHRVSTQASREVTVATFLNSYKLQGVHKIVVEGTNNARSIRR